MSVVCSSSTCQKEEPFDVFICYKETDDAGNRTKDSALAQDIYYQLTDQGLRVFFARITLEDKAGTEYEPYIFAALNSAKVMITVSTEPEYMNAVWVKNEWSRFLSIVKKDRSKVILPCYKDMDPYDLPEQLSVLQSYDMTKIGFIQDLIRGIDKLLGKTEKTADAGHETVIQQVVSGGPNIDALLKRGYDALEDGAFDEAKTFFNDALNSNAKSADAYLGLFMAEIEAPDKAEAQSKYVSGEYTENRYWKRAKQYASLELADTLSSWDLQRNERLQRKADAARMANEKAEEEERNKQEKLTKLQKQLSNGNFEMTAEEKSEYECLKAAAKAAEKTATDAEAALAKVPEMQEITRLEGLVSLKKAQFEGPTGIQEITRLENLISSKKTQFEGLGIFSGREKKELQAQINTLEKTLTEEKKIINELQEQIDTLEKALVDEKKKLSEKQSEVSQLKKQAGDEKKRATEYENQVKTKKAKEIRIEIDRLILHFVKAGDIVNYGTYNQGNGTEPIKWRVLDRQGNKALLISQYALECRKYHNIHTDITWENCDLRKWLNKEFLNTTFSQAEQSLIADTYCPADKNPKSNISPGNATTDKVFLLSISEAEKYFSSDSERLCAPTVYAKAQGASTSDNYKTADGEAACWWWLRSPGNHRSRVAGVLYGSVRCDGYFFFYDSVCVRPALWINLDSQ